MISVDLQCFPDVIFLTSQFSLLTQESICPVHQCSYDSPLIPTDGYCWNWDTGQCGCLFWRPSCWLTTQAPELSKYTGKPVLHTQPWLTYPTRPWHFHPMVLSSQPHHHHYLLPKCGPTCWRPWSRCHPSTPPHPFSPMTTIEVEAPNLVPQHHRGAKSTLERPQWRLKDLSSKSKIILWYLVKN